MNAKVSVRSHAVDTVQEITNSSRPNDSNPQVSPLHVNRVVAMFDESTACEVIPNSVFQLKSELNYIRIEPYRATEC